ncbi:MAG: hypothetical protein R2761_22545 [Acidimicrobiales bacterium]
MAVLAGTNVFTTHGPAWSWRRKALQPSFQRAPTEQLGPTVEAIVEREVDALAPGRLADAQAWFSSVTIAVAAAPPSWWPNAVPTAWASGATPSTPSSP